MIQLFALQSFILSATPLLTHSGIHAAVMSIATIVLKVILMPNLLFWAIRHVSIRREDQPLIGYGKTQILGGFLIGAAFLLSTKLALPIKAASNLLIPTAFSLVMIGFLLLVTRFKAITQVIGYLVMENGIFLFGLTLAEGMPLLVELGILLDVFVAVFVMGIAIYHINHAFDDIDAEKMTMLRG